MRSLGAGFQGPVLSTRDDKEEGGNKKEERGDDRAGRGGKQGD